MNTKKPDDKYDYNNEYECYPMMRSTGFDKLQYMIIKSYPYKIIKKYIKKHKSVINHRNTCSWTTLMIVAANSSQLDNDNKILKLLCNSGCDVNMQTNMGITALSLACTYSKTTSTLNTVKLLLEYKANINLQSKDRITALMRATMFSNTTSNEETVKLLLDHGADINLQTNLGCTALMYAAYNSNDSSTLDTVKILLDHNANIDLQDCDLHTALTMVTIAKQLISVAKLLIQYNANMYLKNRLCQSAFNSENTDIIKLLLDYGYKMDDSQTIIRILDLKFDNYFNEYVYRTELYKKVLKQLLKVTKN